MVEGTSCEGLKLIRNIVERQHQLPGFSIRVAGSAKRDHLISRHRRPDQYGDYGQDGYAIGQNGDSLFVFDGISTYKESYQFGLAIARQLAEERKTVLDYINDDTEMAAAKFMLQGIIQEAIRERQGGVVFSGFIRLSESKILIIKIGDCPIILRKKDGTAKEILSSKNESLQTSGLDHSMEPADYDLQLSIINIEEGDKVIIASDGILTKSSRGNGLEALQRFGNDAQPREIVDSVIKSTPIPADQDDVIVAEVTFTDRAKQALPRAA